jgi:hypothetical protein
VSIVRTGFTYNFWGTGSLDHVQTIANNVTYYLILGSQYAPLAAYRGETTIGTLWIETPSGVVHTMPIRFDQTGIYFTARSQLTNLPVGTTFTFSQALLLDNGEFKN